MQKEHYIFHPKEFLSIPINGELLITGNHNAINQSWCSQMTIKDVLTHHGDWKETGDYDTIQKPLPFELSAIRDAISDYIEEYKYRCGCNYMYKGDQAQYRYL